MDEAFQKSAAPRVFAGPPIEIELHNVVGSHKRWRKRAGHQEALRRCGVAHGNVTRDIEHILLRQDAACRGEVIQRFPINGAARSRGRDLCVVRLNEAG
jgi:hypothetical protein